LGNQAILIFVYRLFLYLRQLAKLAGVSNPYLSQIERGLHQPSVRVIRLISEALNESAETLLAHAGALRRDHPGERAGDQQAQTVEDAIQAEGRLSTDQKSALITVFRSMLPGE